MTQPLSTGPETTDAPSAPKKRPCWLEFVGPAILLILVLGMFHDVLFSDGTRILSAQQQDLTSQFIPWREWGFGLLRQGHLPLWNPHTFAGMPYVGMLQSAMFYPPNILYLFLPIGMATNWGIALHVYLAGVLMYAWARRRTIGPIGATLAGVTYMLCAPYIMHVMPGHVPFLSVAAWTPLVFLVADALIDTPTLGWVLLGIFAVAMQILAGYPQPAYIAAVAASLYLILNIAWSLVMQYFRHFRDGDDVPDRKRWLTVIKSFAGWGVIYVGAAMLSAAQLGPAVSTTAESGRGGEKAPFEFASSFPVPWTNTVCTIVPTFWGDKTHVPYYGEWFVWEIIPYYGAIGLALAIYALIAQDPRRRFAWTVIIVMFALALGKQTPLYRVMYDFFPMFGKFRGSGKFAYGAAPFIAILVGLGYERVREAPRYAFVLAVPALIGAGLCGYWSHQYLATAPFGLDGDWGKMLVWVESSSDPSLPPDQFVGYRQSDGRFFSAKNVANVLGPQFRLEGDIESRNSAEYVSRQLRFAAIILGIFGLLLFATMFDKRAAGLIAVLLVVEMVAFEMGVHITTEAHPKLPEVFTSKADEVKGDRVLALSMDMFNAGMLCGIDNIWGYDPVILRRTVQFVAYSQGMTDPRQLDTLVDQPPFNRVPPYPFVMLRCRYLFVAQNGQNLAVPWPNLPMKRLNLIGSAQVGGNRDDVLAKVFTPTFNPRNSVVLEESPSPAPQGDRGIAEIVREDTDSVEITADTPQPTILLVTDAYSTGWRARELDKDEQHTYKVLPANWMIRAIPLTAGHHHFVMEYSPSEWRMGKAVSLASVPVYFILAVIAVLRRRPATEQIP